MSSLGRGIGMDAVSEAVLCARTVADLYHKSRLELLVVLYQEREDMHRELETTVSAYFALRCSLDEQKTRLAWHSTIYMAFCEQTKI